MTDPVSDARPTSRAAWPFAVVLSLILLAALAGFLWTRPGHRPRHLQLRPIAASPATEAQLRRALAAAGVPLVTGGRDLALAASVAGDRLHVRFDDAREGRTVWTAAYPLTDAPARVARTVACGLGAFDTRKPPLPAAAIPPWFRRCEATVSRAAAR